MVEYVKGELREKGENYAVIEVGGFGIKVLVPKIGAEEGQEVKLFTFLILPPEGTPTLYGFESKEEREFFKKLQKVQKVGSKVALSILAHLSVSELKEVILSGDYERLSQVPGLGKKLSRRIVVELKGEVEEKKVPEELYRALKSLGFKREEITQAVKGINLEGLSLEEALKEALKRLSGS